MIPPEFITPLLVKCEDNYIDALEAHLSSYKKFSDNLLEKLRSDGNISEAEYIQAIGLKDYCQSEVLSILKNYTYKERFITPQDSFRVLIDNLKKVLEKDFFYGSISSETLFYRFRTDKINTEERKKGYALFHIPFSKRRRVNNQRFNSHGTPCLYCADKLSLAWKEVRSPGRMGLDSKKYFNVGIFINDTTLRYLDFSLKDIRALITNSSQLSLYLITYPLIISLHTKIDYENDDGPVYFHNEYVMPSIMMDFFSSPYGKRLFVERGTVKGIRYSSVEDDTRFSAYNYVFPTEYVSPEKEYCQQLTEIFLTKYKPYYLYQDELPEEIKCITNKELTEIEKILLDGVGK